MRKSILAYTFASQTLHNMAQAEAIFQAIADSTRRQIIGMLATRPMNVNAIADKFYVSRQAISLHLQCLRDCGLIVVTQQGRERVCQANLENLDVVTDWVNESKRVWLERFQSLEVFLKAKRKSHGTRKKRDIKKRH